MNLQAKAAAYATAGLALAGIVVFSGMALGVISPFSSGVVSILLTDPPSVPEGVSGVYITYSAFALHATGLGDAGWVATGGQGTIETLSLVNLSQTITSGSVPALRYNLIAFNISSAEVDFLGRNYSATVNGDRLVVPIFGGLTVNSSHAAAAVVDIEPTVLNLGNQISPEFVITTGAKALQVPSGEVTGPMKHLGYRLSLEERGWFQSFSAQHSGSPTIGGITLTSGSFSFSATNPGPDPLTIRMVILTPASPGAREATLGSLSNSVVFAVEPDGSLQLLRMGTAGQARPGLGSAGYQIAGGASADFTYSGTISALISRNGIATGATYYVVILGSHALTVQTVVAG